MTDTPPDTPPDDLPDALPTVEEVGRTAGEILASTTEVVIGQERPLRIALAAILAGGHVLFEDVPGLGKTLAARSLARAMGLPFRRLQCTPDLLPSDITGSLVYAPGSGEFEFRPGPVFTGLLLADELNRTAPKTQSALLEAMAEGQVTVEGTSHPLPRPFHVIATANPIEYEGTYALPEAQLDRFMVRLSVGYPDRAQEERILANRLDRRTEWAEARRVTDADRLLVLREVVERVQVESDVRGYCVDLVAATRAHRSVEVGASPRGSQALMLVARSLAVLDGRDYVIPDDVKEVAVPVLAHRLTLTQQAWATGLSAETLVAEMVDEVAGPPTVAHSAPRP